MIAVTVSVRLDSQVQHVRHWILPEWHQVRSFIYYLIFFNEMYNKTDVIIIVVIF